MNDPTMDRIAVPVHYLGVLVGVASILVLPTIAAGQDVETPDASSDAAPTAQVARSTPATRSSWTADALPIEVGDVVTILIDELTVASANRNEANARGKDRDLAIRGGFGDTSFDGGLRSGHDVSNRTQGESSRRERFTAELSARVVEILPNGVARIEGSKKVRIDRHEQEVTVRGSVRTQDISAAHTVESYRIADAELVYDSNEELGKAGGIWSKLLDMILP